MRFLFTLLSILCLLGPAVRAQEAKDYQHPQEKFQLPAGQRTGTIRKVFVVTFSHLDIGFTKPPDQVARDYKKQIDTAIRLTRENPDFRWTIESSWMLQEWLRRTDDKALIDELGQLLREGRIGLGMTFASMHSGLMAPEESNRLVYLGEQFRHRFDIATPVAFQDDVPGFTWAYPRILAGSGVKYLILGLNLGFGGGNSLGMKKDPFWWVGPDGSRVLTWFTYSSYIEGYFWKLGSLQGAEETIPRRLAWLEHEGYPYDAYLLLASVSDNRDPEHAYRILETIREWNRKHPELILQMATAEEFFSYLTQKYGDKFAKSSGDSSGHWETVKLSVPEVAARMREMSNSLPAAEALATIDSILKGSSFARYDFADAWKELLTFHEHTAGAGPGWPGYFSRWETDWSNVAHYAAAMSGYSNTRQQFSKALIHLVGAPPDDRAAGEPAYVVVYNGLSWKRSGAVVAGELPPELREGPLVVQDVLSGNRQVPEDVPGTHRQILIWASDVPSVGYRLYKIEKADKSPEPNRTEPRLQVAWDKNGVITSIMDRQTKRELLSKQGDHPFGELLVSFGRGKRQAATDLRPEVHVTDGSVARQIEFVKEGISLPRTVVTLYRQAPYLDLQFDVDLKGVQDRELGRAYALALSQLAGTGQMFVDGAGFVLREPQDILPGGAAQHLMPVHFTHLQHAASWGVTLANREAFALRRDLVFDLAHESFVAQTHEEGDQILLRTEPRGSQVQSFHFRIAAQDEQPWEWERLGCELNLPLTAITVHDQFTPASESFFDLNQPGVQLLTFKPAEWRAGWYVLRLQEIAGKEARGVKLTTPLHFQEAVRADTVEQSAGGAINLNNFSLKPWETLTVLVKVK